MVRPAAANNLRNVQSLRKNFENPELLLSRKTESASHVDPDGPLLFSPMELFTYFGPAAAESFISISATLENHQPQVVSEQVVPIVNDAPDHVTTNQGGIDHSFTDDALYGGYPELFGSAFADSSWMRNWIDELQLPSG